MWVRIFCWSGMIPCNNYKLIFEELSTHHFISQSKWIHVDWIRFTACMGYFVVEKSCLRKIERDQTSLWRGWKNTDFNNIQGFIQQIWSIKAFLTSHKHSDRDQKLLWRVWRTHFLWRTTRQFQLREQSWSPTIWLAKQAETNHHFEEIGNIVSKHSFNDVQRAQQCWEAQYYSPPTK